VTVDVIGKMNGALVRHEDRRDVEQDHLYRPVQVHSLWPSRIMAARIRSAIG